MKLGINGATIPSADLLTGIRAAASAGFTHYEPRLPNLLAAEASKQHEAAQTALAESSLQWLPLNALEDVFATPRATLLDRAGRLFRLASSFGISQIIVVPGSVTRRVSRETALTTLNDLKRTAESYDVGLLYEFIGFPHHAFSALDVAREVAREAELPVVLDTFHLAISETDGSALRKMNLSEIGLVHLSDALVGDSPIGQIEDKDRVLPGDGDLPLAEYLQALTALGYDGPMSVEVFHPKYSDVDPYDGARDARNRVCQILEEAQEQTKDRGNTKRGAQ
jgi:2-keto-myo-inositol isomerase